MNFELIAVEIISVTIELIVIYHFFKSMLMINLNGTKNKTIILLVFITILFSLCFVDIFIDNTFINFGSLALCTFLISTLYQGELKNKVSLSSILTVIFVLCEIGIGMIMSIISSKSMDEMSTNTMLYFQGMFISKMSAFIIVKGITFFKGKHSFRLSLKTWIGMMIIPLTSIISIAVLTEVAYKTNNVYDNLFVLLIAVCQIFANVVVFYLFEKELKIEEDKVRYSYIEKQLDDEKVYYEMIAQKQKEVNRTAHDMKNALASILGSILDKKTAEAETKIREMLNFTSEKEQIVYTGNISIDTMLNLKNEKIEKYGIDFNIVCTLGDVRFDDIGLCIVLGNALDNSIEACQKIAQDKRYIKLAIKSQNSSISCLIENPIGKETLKSGDKTTKSDRFHHGFGIDNMKAIVEKNEGNIVFKREDKKYIVSILFRIK